MTATIVPPARILQSNPIKPTGYEDKSRLTATTKHGQYGHLPNLSLGISPPKLVDGVTINEGAEPGLTGFDCFIPSPGLRPPSPGGRGKISFRERVGVRGNINGIIPYGTCLSAFSAWFSDNKNL
jgi:hypothetical protein